MLGGRPTALLDTTKFEGVGFDSGTMQAPNIFGPMSKPPDDKKSQADQARAIAKALSRKDMRQQALEIAESLESQADQPKPKRKPRRKRKSPDQEPT